MKQQNNITKKQQTNPSKIIRKRTVLTKQQNETNKQSKKTTKQHKRHKSTKNSNKPILQQALYS